MSENALVTKAAMPLVLNGLQDVLSLGDVLAKSGFFADARTAAQAVVKVLAGRELGFQTIASMVGVHIIEGKPSIGAHLLAAAIKRSGRYDYRLIRCDREACELEFLEKRGDAWVALGRTTMTMQEATQTGLALGRDGRLKANWARSADDMLFARCVSKGYRRYCPDLTGGVLVYDPDELDNTPQVPGEIVDAGYTVTQPNGDQTHVGDRETVTVHAPVPPTPGPETPRPNPQLPAPMPGTAEETLTEQEQQACIQLAREHKRTANETSAMLAVCGARMLERVPRSKLGWLQHALTTGLASESQVGQITALVTKLQLDWVQFRARLKAKYQAESIAHLLPSQAEQIIASLQQALKQQQNQTAPAA